MYRFTFKGFSPRWTFKRASNRWLGNAMNLVPRGTVCQAVASREDKGVLFSLELNVSGSSYKRQLLLDETVANREGVDWQVTECHRIGTVIVEDLRQWIEKNGAQQAPNSRRSKAG